MRKMRKGIWTERPQGGHIQRCSVWRGTCHPPEKNADLLEFTPEFTHLLVWEVYGDYPYRNKGSHLDREVVDNAIWQCRWLWLSAQLASSHATHSGAVGRHFRAILVAEWRGVIVRSWNYTLPLVFSHFFPKKDVGWLQGQGYPGADHQANRPLGERYPHRPVRRLQGGRGYQGGKVCQWRRGEG